jgi:glutamate synthase (NADPH) small chain
MGKPTGFMEYGRKEDQFEAPEKRIGNFNEFHVTLDLEERCRQGARCMDCGVPFCQSGMVLDGAVTGCPLNNVIPEWNDMLFLGNWKHALARLLKTDDFPEFTGRVCPAPCEAACTCAFNGDAVTIRDNELAIIEYAFEHGYMQPRPPALRSGKKVAVIGSGPSGLATADMLNRRGHTVTVYEREDRPGGLLMYGIPNMKLDKKIVDRRITLMTREGVRFVTNAHVGLTADPGEILREYDAVVLCCGAAEPRDLKIPGRDAKGIFFAVDYLRSVTKSVTGGPGASAPISAKDKNVLVVGGGDTGNDCVGTAIRQGCRSILQIEMMPQPPDTRAQDNPWPRWPRVRKTDYGQQEAAALFGSDPRVYQTTVKECRADENGALAAVTLIKLSVEKDAANRLVIKEIPGSEYTVPAEMLLIAAGFLGCQRPSAESFGAAVSPRGNVDTKPGSHRTNTDKVFTAGDMHIGQSLVVRAIADGRAAARETDEYLMGYTGLR